MGVCNYCMYRSMKRRVKKGYKLVNVPARRNGVYVFEVPIDVSIREVKKLRPTPHEIPTICTKRQKDYRGWFWELPTSCRC